MFAAGRGGRYTYHGPGQRVAYVMLDLNARARDVHAFVAALEAWLIDALARLGVAGVTREGRVGVWVERGDWPGGQDRRDRRAAAALGELSRSQPQRRSGPSPLRRHRPLRHRRARRHQPRRAGRPNRSRARRCGLAGRFRSGVRFDHHGRRAGIGHRLGGPAKNASSRYAPFKPFRGRDRLTDAPDRPLLFRPAAGLGAAGDRRADRHRAPRVKASRRST